MCPENLPPLTTTTTTTTALRCPQDMCRISFFFFQFSKRINFIYVPLKTRLVLYGHQGRLQNQAVRTWSGTTRRGPVPSFGGTDVEFLLHNQDTLWNFLKFQHAMSYYSLKMILQSSNSLQTLHAWLFRLHLGPVVQANVQPQIALSNFRFTILQMRIQFNQSSSWVPKI